MGEIVSLAYLKRLKRKNAKVVLAGGTFDLLHIGHLRYLTKAKSLGDILVVCVKSDKEVRKRKGAFRPTVKQHSRAALVAALACVDYAFISHLPTRHPRNLAAVNPNVLCLAERAHKERMWKVEKEKVAATFPNIKVRFIRVRSVPSTTLIINKIKRSLIGEQRHGKG